MDKLPAGRQWYIEQITPELYIAEGLTQLIYSGKTKYQDVEILETIPWGKSLVLDGRTQSSEADEWVYHEALVQPVMLAHANPLRVFIAGGGEGATAREVLKHSSVEEVVMVDLDEEVVRLCEKYLPNLHQGSFKDPRMTLLHQDALAYLQNHDQGFDIVIIDVPDPLESGPAYMLFTQEFYQLVKSRLNPGGLMVAQSGPAGPTNVSETLTAIHQTIGSVYSSAEAYRIFMPSFGTPWGFVIGLPEQDQSVAASRVDGIDSRVTERVKGHLQYYDGIAHQGMFSLPKYIRSAFAQEDRIITMANPLYAV